MLDSSHDCILNLMQQGTLKIADLRCHPGLARLVTRSTFRANGAALQALLGLDTLEDRYCLYSGLC